MSTHFPESAGPLEPPTPSRAAEDSPLQKKRRTPAREEPVGLGQFRAV